MKGTQSIPISPLSLYKLQDNSLWERQTEDLLCSCGLAQCSSLDSSDATREWCENSGTILANAFRIAVAQDGSISKKNVWRKISFYDPNLCSSIAKLVTQRLPVRKRQCAWFPEAYHRPTDFCCPQCNGEVSVDHFLKCSSRKAGCDLALVLHENSTLWRK